jgi:hypothetical protein
MAFLISLTLPFLLCLVLAGVSSLMWRDMLTKPMAFGAIAFLATFGLHRLIQAATEVFGLFSNRGYFLEARGRPDILKIAEGNMNTQTLVQCTLLVALGIPLLYWLRATMVKA